jgi:hypothetical protein
MAANARNQIAGANLEGDMISQGGGGAYIGAQGVGLGGARFIGAQGVNLGSLGTGALSVLSGVGGFTSMLTGGGANMAQFQLQDIVKQQSKIARDDSLIAMIQSGNMPIEDLIAYFMIQMEGNYEDDLRQKMQEAAIQDEVERQQSAQSQMLSGLGSILNTFTSGAGGGITSMFSGMLSQAQNAANPNQKSATMLMQEVQILTEKWKQMTELCSNLLKDLSDMTMTPIRNIR